FEMKAALTVAALAGVVGAAALIVATRGGDEQASDGPPETPDQLMAQMEDRLSEDDDLLRVQLQSGTQDDGVQATVDVDGLFDFQEGQALISYVTTWENNPDDPVRRQELLEGGYVYEIPTMPATPGRSDASESRAACLDVGSYLGAILAC